MKKKNIGYRNELLFENITYKLQVYLFQIKNEPNQASVVQPKQSLSNNLIIPVLQIESSAENQAGKLLSAHEKSCFSFTLHRSGFRNECYKYVVDFLKQWVVAQ